MGKQKTASLVRITTTGKLSFLVGPQSKKDVLALLESGANARWKHRNAKLEMGTVNGHVHVAILHDLFVKYETSLNRYPSPTRMLLSRSEALVLWGRMQHDLEFFNPETGNLVMQLHQKLS